MSIEFACPKCGKSYVVGDELAGKRGRCKQCSSTMQIPTPARSAAGPSADDLYGLDDGPAAPLPPRGAYAPRDSSYEDAPVPPVKKKKKKVGFFASGSKKKKGGNSGTVFAGVAGVSGLGVLFIVLRVALFSGGFFMGMSGRWEVERFVQADLDSINELTTIFKSITDEPTAQTAAPKAVLVVQKMVDRYRAALGKKAPQKAIDDVNNEYAPKIQAASQAFSAEASRVAQIPGASQHLRVMAGPLNELNGLLPPEARQGPGFFMPTMPMPPRMPPPQFQPPSMPPAPPPMPNVGPQPGMPGFGPGPNNGGFPGPPPGMRRPPGMGPRFGGGPR